MNMTADTNDRKPIEGLEPTPEAAEGEAAAPSQDLAAAYQKALAEKEEYYNLALRARAELDNFRKRTAREKEEFLQQANADLMRSLLPTLDGFDRALKHRDTKIPAKFYEGLELIHRQLLETLEKAGLAVIETDGESFDPHLHQAVETVELAERRDQEIVEELQRGYKVKQRLLRPALVKVAVRAGQGKPKDEAGA